MAASIYCVVIPTYNNPLTVRKVAERVLNFCPDVVVVDDGSAEPVEGLLKGLPLTVLTHEHNRGKGAALRTGFRYAMQAGFTHAITIDSDAQHYPEDIPALVSASEAHPEDFVIGSRCISVAGMPRGNSFANRFSNFWFKLQTGQKLPDTQTGYRVYPLKHLYGLSFLTSRYEAELELMVFACWNGVKMRPVPVHVDYPDDRVTHFRPFVDFFRISVLNTVLCFGALFYGLPKKLISKL